MSEPGKKIVITAAILFFFFILLQTAWMGDDAYITARSVENFVQGYGPVYNVGERVQTFTHPLWFFLISIPYFLLVRVFQIDVYGQYYYLVMGISLLFSTGAVAIFTLKIAKRSRMLILGIVALSLSRSYVDYSTSGLETPATFFLAALFLWVYFEDGASPTKKMRRLALIVALSALNRLDTVLLYLPALIYTLLADERKLREKLLASLQGASPLLAWLIFSVIYYGFPFPNTAYAKLNTGISAGRLLQQGFYYFLDSIDTDPTTLLVTCIALATAIILGNRKQVWLMTGVILYLLYVLKIGGDFMSGRFFATGFLISVASLSQYELSGDKVFATAAALLLLVGFSSPRPTLLSHQDYGSERDTPEEWISPQGIADERAYYYPATGLLTDTRYKIFFESPYSGVSWQYEASEAKGEVAVVGTSGWAGYVRGPLVHVIDRNGLVDPFMARLPVIDLTHWRIGHFHHIIPNGYEETLQTGENRFDDPRLWVYFQELTLVTRGELFSQERWVAIWRLNTGQYDELLDNYARQYRKELTQNN